MEGDRDAGIQQNRGQERVGSGRTGGRKQDLYEGGKQVWSRNKEGNSLLFITGYYSVKNTSIEKF